MRSPLPSWMYLPWTATPPLIEKSFSLSFAKARVVGGDFKCQQPHNNRSRRTSPTLAKAWGAPALDRDVAIRPRSAWMGGCNVLEKIRFRARVDRMRLTLPRSTMTPRSLVRSSRPSSTAPLRGLLFFRASIVLGPTQT